MKCTFSFAALAALCVAGLLPAQDAEPARVGRPGKSADALTSARQKNWREARAKFDASRAAVTDWQSPAMRHAVEGSALCSVKLDEWENALAVVQEYGERTQGTLAEALALRFLAGLNWTMPDSAKLRGGKVVRGPTPDEGGSIQLGRRDRLEAIRLYERARLLLARLESGTAVSPDRARLLRAERIGVNFDLAATLLQQNAKDIGEGVRPSVWWLPRAQAEAVGTPEEEVGSTARGLPLDAAGQPQFLPRAGAYSDDFNDGQKVLFLLAEVEQLDQSPTRADAALAAFRRALIAHRLYDESPPGEADAERASVSDEEENPAPAATPSPVLADDEAWVLVQGKVRRLQLPPSESPMALLREVIARHPRTEAGYEAAFALERIHLRRNQFDRAVTELQALSKRNPPVKVVALLREKLRTIQRPQVALEAPANLSPGQPSKLKLSARAGERVDLRAVRWDLPGLVRERTALGQDWKEFGHLKPAVWAARERGPVKRWSVPVRPERPWGTATAELELPFREPGTYLVEARLPGSTTVARAVQVVSEMALVVKRTPDATLIFLLDARDGRPCPGQSIEVTEFEGEFRKLRRWGPTVLTTDADGLVRYRRKSKEESRLNILHADAAGRFASVHVHGPADSTTAESTEMARQARFVLDRPVYRPGMTVRMRAWVRERTAVGFAPPQAGERVVVRLESQARERSETQESVTDEAGGVTVEFPLPADAPLGPWKVSLATVNKPDDSLGSTTLFVEEYRKPELELLVRPETLTAQLGQKVKVRIEGRYYFGAAAAGLKLKYRLMRSDYDTFRSEIRTSSPEQGTVELSYPWLPWSMAANIDSRKRGAARDDHTSGEAELDASGAYVLEIDTAPDRARLGDRDHRYDVEVTVVDSSRRTVTSAGGLTAVRTEFAAAVTTASPWFADLSPIPLLIRTGNAVGLPVSVAGEVTVARLHYPTDGRGEPREEVVWRESVRTDTAGSAKPVFRPATSGQFRLRFMARDSTGASVEGNGLIWIVGADFDPAAHRFRSLEIIPDRASYRVGETARLLVATQGDLQRLLFSDEAVDGHWLRWRAMPMNSRLTIVEVPIEHRHVPMLHVEAVSARAGRLLTESVELSVPRAVGRLQLKLLANRASFLPGGSGKLVLEARDDAGQPVAGEAAISGTDAALAVYGQDFADLSFGQERWVRHRPWGATSMGRQIYQFNHLQWPYFYTHYDIPLSAEWGQGFWTIEHFSLRLGGRDLFSAKALPTASLSEAEEYRDRAARKGLYEYRGQSYQGAEPARVIVTGSYIPTSESYGPIRGAEEGLRVLKAPVVRSNLADAAIWLPKVVFGPDGRAEADFQLPDTLTRWNVSAFALAPDSRCGAASTAFVTAKNVIVRLQSPRFFVERDEVTLSAIAHNYLLTAQQVRGELLVPAALFEAILPVGGGQPAPDADGNLTLHAEAEVAPGAQHRFDWRVRALRPGQAQITARALTVEESDAVQMSFPLQVHGVQQQVADSGSFRSGQDGTRTLHFEIPSAIDSRQTQLVVELSPSLVGVMADALPFLADYPYGCVEQTVSRFYPTAVLARLLREWKVDLAAVQPRPGDPRREREFAKSPLTDAKKLARMVEEGFARLDDLRNPDGGYSWWGQGPSSPYQTAFVAQALQEEADQARERYALRQSIRFLQADFKTRMKRRTRHVGEAALDVMIAGVLARERVPGRETADDRQLQGWLRQLHARRGELNPQGLALLAIAHQRAGLPAEAALALRNLLQFVQRDETNETAWVRTPATHWWFWFQNDIETNAWALRALLAVEPKSELAPKLVKWLVQNRRGGAHWRSTRDTALTLVALSDYLRVSREATADAVVQVQLDGTAPREVRLTKGGLLGGGERLEFPADQLPPGRHALTLKKSGRGALYFAARLNYFNQASEIESAGGELSVERLYFRVPKPPAGGAAATPEPVPLRTGDALAGGEEIEVVLRVKAKNGYDFLAFEDRKPAGCEPVELRSGPRFQDGLSYHFELRDAKTAFFVEWLPQGESEVRYRLRAETPGLFRAPPAIGFGMYAPELRANSRTMRVQVRD